jgi:hypothetical protein
LEPKKVEFVAPERVDGVRLSSQVGLLSALETATIVETVIEEEGKQLLSDDDSKGKGETESNLVPSDEFLKDVSKQNRE